MTQKDKKLLLQDLCARLPYGVKVLDNSHKNYGVSKLINIGVDGSMLVDNEINDIQYYPIIDEVKPYLRSLSSITDEEREEWTDLFNKQLLELEKYSDEEAEEIAPQMFAMSHFSSINWLYSKHFNIILPKDAFIEVTEENNPYENNNQKTI